MWLGRTPRLAIQYQLGAALTDGVVHGVLGKNSVDMTATVAIGNLKPGPVIACFFSAVF